MADSQSAHAIHSEQETDLANRVYEASVKFGGPLLSGQDLPFITYRGGYVHSHWGPVPSDHYAAKHYGREMAFALLSVAPNEYNDRQIFMAMKVSSILGSQFRAIERLRGGEQKRIEMVAIWEFWETITKVAELSAFKENIDSWRLKLDRADNSAQERLAGERALVKEERSQRARRAANARWVKHSKAQVAKPVSGGNVVQLPKLGMA